MENDTKHDRWGCFCDNSQADGCVFDGADGMNIEDCTVAEKLSADGKGKTDCEYWKKYIVCSECGNIISCI